MGFWGKRGGDTVAVVRECGACGYVACICATLQHAPTCTRRRVLLAELKPLACPHDVVGCAICFPCDCGKEGVR